MTKFAKVVDLPERQVLLKFEWNEDHECYTGQVTTHFDKAEATMNYFNLRQEENVQKVLEEFNEEMAAEFIDMFLRIMPGIA